MIASMKRVLDTKHTARKGRVLCRHEPRWEVGNQLQHSVKVGCRPRGAGRAAAYLQVFLWNAEGTDLRWEKIMSLCLPILIFILSDQSITVC